MSTAIERNGQLDWIEAPARELVRLSWPIAVSMLSYSVMTLVDTLFVGRLGAAALAGVGLGGTAAFTLLCFSIGLLFGVKVLVSQAAGAGKSGEEKRAFLGAGLVMAAVLGGFTVLSGWLLEPWIAAISATADAAGSVSDYFGVRILGAPLMLMFVALRESRYGVGDARTPMRATLLANALNILLDYLLIIEAGLGVAGAAWASVTAHGTEMLYLVVAQLPRGFGLRYFRLRHVLAVARVGLPTGLQFVLEIGSFMMLAALIAALSETEMAAHQIALQVIHFAFLPAWAVSEATSVLTGQAVGADRDRLVRRVARVALGVSSLYTGACTLVLLVASPWIVSLFNSQAGVLDTAVKILYVSAIFLVADGANMIARGALRGTGDVRIPAAIGILTAWAFTPPLTWLLGYRAGLGALGGWTGLCAEIFIGAAILWWRLEREHWLPAAQRSRAEMQQEPLEGLAPVP